MRYALSLFALLLFFAATPVVVVSAQNPLDVPPELLESLKKEPALTQADLDLFLATMPKILEDPTKEEEIFTAAGITRSRAIFVTVKTTLGFLTKVMGVPLEQLDPQKNVPEFLQPTDADAALLETNKVALMGLYQQMAASAQK